MNRQISEVFFMDKIYFHNNYDYTNEDDVYRVMVVAMELFWINAWFISLLIILLWLTTLKCDLFQKNFKNITLTIVWKILSAGA